MKRFFLLNFIGVFLATVGVVSAVGMAPPSGGYTSDLQVIDPDCSQGDTDCFVNLSQNSKFIDGVNIDDAIYLDGNVGIGTDNPSAILDIESINAATPVLVTQAAASQTANIAEVRNSDGVLIGGIAPQGQLFSLGGSANIENLAMGFDALANNTTGEFNVAVGTRALFNNTTGTRNFGLGNAALVSNTTGDSNVAIGTFSMADSVTGKDNIAIGKSALTRNIDGNENTAVGAYALNDNVSGLANVGVGTWAGAEFTTGSGNVALGNFAGGYSRFGVTPANKTGNFNLYLGSYNRGTNGANHEIIIGTDDTRVGGTNVVRGNGSNTVTIGGTNNTDTFIRGTVHTTGYAQEPLSSDPADPDVGHSVQWISDGTGSGDAGDVMIKINVGGTVKTTTLIDFSAII